MIPDDEDRGWPPYHVAMSVALALLVGALAGGWLG